MPQTSTVSWPSVPAGVRVGGAKCSLGLEKACWSWASKHDAHAIVGADGTLTAPAQLTNRPSRSGTVAARRLADQFGSAGIPGHCGIWFRVRGSQTANGERARDPLRGQSCKGPAATGVDEEPSPVPGLALGNDARRVARAPVGGSVCSRSGVVPVWLILPVVICLSQRLSHAGVRPPDGKTANGS